MSLFKKFRDTRKHAKSIGYIPKYAVVTPKIFKDLEAEILYMSGGTYQFHGTWFGDMPGKSCGKFLGWYIYVTEKPEHTEDIWFYALHPETKDKVRLMIV